MILALTIEVEEEEENKYSFLHYYTSDLNKRI